MHVQAVALMLQLTGRRQERRQMAQKKEKKSKNSLAHSMATRKTKKELLIGAYRDFISMYTEF